MKIRKAKKEDFSGYLKLKRAEDKDYSKITGKKITYLGDSILRKEFLEILRDKKILLLVVEENKKLIGYMHATFFKNIYRKGGYVGDLFVLREFRRKGIATKLINKFIKALKNRGYKMISLSVNIKNKKAIILYKKLGFNICNYDLKKEWK